MTGRMVKNLNSSNFYIFDTERRFVMYHMNGMQWGMGVGWFVLAGILFMAVWFIARFVHTGDRSSEGKKKSALDILKKRYAGGEIGKDEYLEKKKILS